MAEHCISWEPVPAYANRHFALGVLRCDISASEDGSTLISLLAIAPKDRPGPGSVYRGIDGWRITFRRVLGMQLRSVPDWVGADPIPHPPQWEFGAWEVANSSWLGKIIPPGHSWEMHHYVVTDEDMLYEIAAEGWTSEALPAGWEAEFGFEVR